ncbi:Mitochondrial translocator assembly and maintenance protein 41 [Zalerion maritima]|uniref:Phosphatidate cytidylyltransferase, mitochondrial n=1 Tax=Zalerion maritima TaxID=339359 RepID=A0AAD5RUK3_9PEZI|nr:Mitochondrial translocator assembly and maintenance protein 41 [Zalerion maritima]
MFAHIFATQLADKSSDPETTPNPKIGNGTDKKDDSDGKTCSPKKRPIDVEDSWEDDPRYKKWKDMEKYSDLPHANFGVNQHMVIQDEFKKALKGIMWQFPSSLYAFAYGSGVFPQSTGGAATEEQARAVHPKSHSAILKAQNGTPKMIDFILGVSHSEHWHSLNLRAHKDHYSFLASLPFSNSIIPAVQDNWGAGVYFNTHVVVNGTLIKYGVVNIDTFCRDLMEWDTLYLAGRLHKPVKILRDNPQVRLANQMNLISALRTSLLLLPEKFSERDLYNTIASLSYLGDPRMAFPTENPQKVANIVGYNMENFRNLYQPLIEALPNLEFLSPPEKAAGGESVSLEQDMDPVKRGNMVRRLPKAFREKLYFQYQRKFAIPQVEFDKMMEANADEDGINTHRREGGGFERRIATDGALELRRIVREVIKSTVSWPSTTQTLKGPFTAGPTKTMKYLGEKMAKYREGKK